MALIEAAAHRSLNLQVLKRCTQVIDRTQAQGRDRRHHPLILSQEYYVGLDPALALRLNPLDTGMFRDARIDHDQIEGAAPAHRLRSLQIVRRFQECTLIVQSFGEKLA